MGHALSRDSGEPDFESGIAVSPGVISDLLGKPSAPPATAQPSENTASRRQARLDKALQDRYNLDTSLIEACKASERVGDLLLKSEGEELSRVRAYAEDLIRKEYRIPSHEMPCQEFKDATLECYTRNPQDVFQCASIVEAYSRCAEEARRQWAQRS